jgi:putative phage-type endonuclease
MHPKVKALIEKTYDDQRSDEWFKLRGNMLTASDLAAALGVNFFKKPCELILEKCGYKKFSGNENTARGIRLEPFVRDMYDKKYGTTTHEIGLLVHPEYSWLGGSPDGVTEDGVLIEIKCPKKLSTKIPDYYFPQVQLLLEIMDLDTCDFVQYCEEKDVMTVIQVPRDREWFAEQLPRMRTFWDTVLYKRAHGICELIRESPQEPE